MVERKPKPQLKTKLKKKKHKIKMKETMKQQENIPRWAIIVQYDH